MKKKPNGPMPCAIAICGSPEWREWVNEFARSQRLPVACLIDRLLAEAAKAKGFPDAPARL